MKKYEKPIIIKNEEPAEGVYAESGNCMYAEIRDMRYDGDGTMRFKVWYQHRASNDHCALGTYITLGFSTAVYLSDTSGYVASGNGTQEIRLKITNALHSDGDCQTDFNCVGKATNGSTNVEAWVIGCDDTEFRIVDDHIKP